MILTNEGMVVALALGALLGGILVVCSLVEWLGKGKRVSKEAAQVGVTTASGTDRGPWLSVSLSGSGRRRVVPAEPRGARSS